MTDFSKNDGIYLGYPTSRIDGPPDDIDGNPIQYIGDRHILTYGPNGSGKSRRALLPNLINMTDWSMIVLDVKGTLALQTAEHRRQAGNEIVFLNPFGVNGLPDHGLNVVDALDATSDDFIDDALSLAEAIITRDGGRDSHWDNSAEDLLNFLIMYSRLCG